MSTYKITIKNITKDKDTIGEDLTGKDVIVGKTTGKNAEIGYEIKDNSIAIGKTIGDLSSIGWDMKDNSIVIGKTTGYLASVGNWMKNNSIAIGKTIGKEAYVGHSMNGNSIAIGKTTGKKAHVGHWMIGNNIVIGKTTGESAYVGENMKDNSIAIGKTTGNLAHIGRSMKDNSIVIGKTAGEEADIGCAMFGNSIVIGKTTGKTAYIGQIISNNSITIGFETNKFIIKHAAYRPYLITKNSKEFTPKIQKLSKLLDLDDFLDDNLFETEPYTVHKKQKHKLDPEHWSDHIDNKSFQKNTIFPAVKALQASRVLKLGNKQILPIEGEPRNLQFLKQISEYDRICEILSTAESILIEQGVPAEYWKETMDIQKKRFEMKSMELIEKELADFPKELRKKTFTEKKINTFFNNVSKELGKNIEEEEKFKDLKKTEIKEETKFAEIFTDKDKGIALSFVIEFTDDGKFKSIDFQSYAEKVDRRVSAYAQDFYDVCTKIIEEQVDRVLLGK